MRSAIYTDNAATACGKQIRHFVSICPVPDPLAHEAERNRAEPRRLARSSRLGPFLPGRTCRVRWNRRCGHAARNRARTDRPACRLDAIPIGAVAWNWPTRCFVMETCGIPMLKALAGAAGVRHNSVRLSIPGSRCSQGGVKVPTGGKGGQSPSPRAPPFLIFKREGSADSV